MPDPTALPLRRLPRQTLHHVWAPKLGRTIVLNGLGQLRLWAMLEARPGVTRYCERPFWPDDERPSPGPDFWALRGGTPVWLALQEAPVCGNEVPAPAEAPRVQVVAAEELDRHRVWIGNWLSLLPYPSATAGLDLEALSGPVADFFLQEASFDDAERHFVRFDPVLVRTAVVAGLHRGVLFSTDLLVRPWDRQSRVVRCAGAASHAPH